MNRLSLLHKLDGLLSNCKTCERKQEFNNTVSPEVICKGCSTYGEIRGIGENLGRKKQMPKVAFDMSVSEYLNLQATMNKRGIAKHLGISEGTLYAWINKNETKIKALLGNVQTATGELQPSESKTITHDKTTEYERLIKALRNDLKEAHTQLDEKDEVLRKYENIDAACEDVERENATLREEKCKLQEECSKLLDKQYEDDYRLENMKKRVEYFVKKVEEFEKENKALRELVKLWS